MTPDLDHAADFLAKNYAMVRGFLSSEEAATISRYMEYSLKANRFSEERVTDEKNAPSKYCLYADPLSETLLYNSLPAVSSVVQKELYPTYSYSRIYVRGDKLAAHTDRPSCEYSVTINIDAVGNPWPVWMKSPNGTPVKHVLHPGDAIVYKGCEVEHWRDAMDDTELNAQVMLHYVDKNGPNAEYKWDKRPGLGFASGTRRSC